MFFIIQQYYFYFTLKIKTHEVINIFSEVNLLKQVIDIYFIIKFSLKVQTDRPIIKRLLHALKDFFFELLGWLAGLSQFSQGAAKLHFHGSTRALVTYLNFLSLD